MLAAVLANQALGHDGTKHGSQDQPANAAPPSAADVRVTIADVGLVDRGGRAINFKSEALADRIVAIDFVYTSCVTACPIISAIFAEVQSALQDRLGRDAWLLSVSINPTRDTPGRMDKTARKFNARPGWLWLTGAKADVDQVLVGLGAYTPDIETHPPMILIGDVTRDKWVRLYGFVSPDEITARIDDFLAARGKRQTLEKTGD
jgi:protein SCO1/2